MKYPAGIRKNNNTIISTSNRGMNLESDINLTNEYYLRNNIAVIYKKPTPITINKVDYPCRKDAVIKEAHFKIPSTTDYNGIFKGRYIDFEVKETKKDFFPLSNIHKHQVEHLKRIIEHGGIGFIIVSFTKYNKFYLLEGKKLFDFIDNNERKSIPYEYIKNNAIEVKMTLNGLDYLSKLGDKI